MIKREYVKIWNELLVDVKFQNLTLAQQSQFLNLLIFVNIYGAGGALIIQPPAQMLAQTLRCQDYTKLKYTLKKISEIFKGFSYSCNDKEDVIIFKNWHKYQIDDSSERVRRHRLLNVTNVTKAVDVSKDLCGVLQNVKLTKDEHQKLTDKFGEEKAASLIVKLSLYIASKGDKYKSHYATILNWAQKEEINKPKSGAERIAEIMGR